MDTFLIVLGALFCALIGYGVGFIFNRNKVGALFSPKLWAVLGLFFGLQGLLFGTIYGLVKLLICSRR